MVKIGIVGASGFVGNRAVEMLHDEGMTVCPIVRHAASLQPFTQRGLNGYVANAFDQTALEKAFSGCDVVIHSVLGSPGLIRGSVAPAYRAAQKAGVRRLIYLSSMIVHTSAPAPGTTEATPPIDYQPGFPTHTAKIDAERKLLRLRKKGSVEVVIFRPGVVFGPRSRWITELADQLTQGTAYFINDGSGVCNTVYVDNLIHAMRLAIDASGVDGEAFFVGDREYVTWLDFYRPFAATLKVDLHQIPQLSPPQFTHSKKQQWSSTIRESEVVQKGLALLSDDLKQTMKSIFPKRSRSAVEILPPNPVKPQPVITEMMTILQKSQYKLPFTKAEEILGYKPIISFEEGCRRSIAWLIDSQHPTFSQQYNSSH
jgi:2-alkyl-3-oxoalkanoate reductase